MYCHSPPATSTTSSGLTLLLTVWPGATQSTKLLPSSKLTEETHLKTRDRGGRLAPPPPLHQTLHFPADTARGPASPASVWSATSVPAVNNNMDKLHKSSFAKPSHDECSVRIILFSGFHNISVRNCDSYYVYYLSCAHDNH